MPGLVRSLSRMSLLSNSGDKVQGMAEESEKKAHKQDKKSKSSSAKKTASRENGKSGNTKATSAASKAGTSSPKATAAAPKTATAAPAAWSAASGDLACCLACRSAVSSAACLAREVFVVVPLFSLFCGRCFTAGAGDGVSTMYTSTASAATRTQITALSDDHRSARDDDDLLLAGDFDFPICRNRQQLLKRLKDELVQDVTTSHYT